MTIVRSTTFVVQNPAAPGITPHLAIGIRQGSDADAAAAPDRNGSSAVVAVVPAPAATAASAASATPAGPPANARPALNAAGRAALRTNMAMTQQRRNIVATSLTATGTLTGVGAMALLGNTLARGIVNHWPAEEANVYAARFASVAAAGTIGTALIGAGIAVLMRRPPPPVAPPGAVRRPPPGAVRLPPAEIALTPVTLNEIVIDIPPDAAAPSDSDSDSDEDFGSPSASPSVTSATCATSAAVSGRSDAGSSAHANPDANADATAGAPLSHQERPGS